MPKAESPSDIAVTGLDAWIARQARFSADAMARAISATHLVTDRTGFGQRIVPRPGSVLASPVPGHYDPDPDYFFHWFRDSSIVIDAVRVALAEGFVEKAAFLRFREFVEFSESLCSLDGRDFLRNADDFRAKVQPSFLQFVRPDEEIVALSGNAVLCDVRVNPDGTLDFIRWSRPQTDGPALRCIVLMRWLRQFPDLDATLQTAVRTLIDIDRAFTLSQADKPSFDIWEDKYGYHYYTQLVQMEALGQSAGWLAQSGQNSKARTCRTAAAAIAARLDTLWNATAGYYRSRTDAAGAQLDNDLDIAAILGVLHAGRAAGAHAVLDPRAQSTLTALEELFETEYAINRDHPAGRGPALGRLANDTYFSGGAYYFATLAAAEFYFRLATALLSGAELAATEENGRFRQRLGALDGATDGHALAAASIARGDAIMRTVQAFTPAGGELSEQFDQNTGEQTSAKHLTWSYAAFITAAASRAQAYRRMRDINPTVHAMLRTNP